MYCVGLTGNIASGKSTVSRYFKEFGIAVISADEAARELTAANQPALLSIAEHFGQSIIDAGGELNRLALREMIFSDPKQRIWLEQLLHPLIRQHIRDKIKKSSGPYVIIEIPLLNKRSDYPYLDRILLVVAGHEQKISRVKARDQITREQAEAILATQANEAIHREFADDIIINDDTLENLAKKVGILHEQYLQFASQKS
ncbi:dephospho-CoA kinase [Legionella micdadei]|uniref:Dephospho-CoA kinase n=1 Tax=Legionella micdadei TaxID=451 RepID=A0A098GHD2_LEGMI|nr:dephospho-CoA kinase [Legionella micdadei]ARG97546.1 dephospho-CoA kinase [Legionella micdadei]ARH00141.1 dephospho-CoA kinase [Legionella micdadei]KTD27623.1 dephospho-CoA kinase [Legionella micdadei]NSL17606.1 dephospho-CoA kinase [Legionella micdadei]CEG60891.1 Dephospho-CoA kinase [Legionella micdadei]